MISEKRWRRSSFFDHLIRHFISFAAQGARVEWYRALIGSMGLLVGSKIGELPISLMLATIIIVVNFHSVY